MVDVREVGIDFFEVAGEKIAQIASLLRRKRESDGYYSRMRFELFQGLLRVPFHVGAKRKAENKQPITELLLEERNLKIFYYRLLGFCFAFCAHMRRHRHLKAVFH